MFHITEIAIKLTPGKNMSNQSEMPNRKTITLRLNYFPDLKPQMAVAVDFVLEKLKFYPTEEFKLSSELKRGLIVLARKKFNKIELIKIYLKLLDRLHIDAIIKRHILFISEDILINLIRN